MYKRVNLNEIFYIKEAPQKIKREPYEFQCKHCGKHRKVDGYLVWTKFCNKICYKEFLEEKKRIKKILARQSKLVV